MNENQSIRDTLNVIRKALEEDDTVKVSEKSDNILVLNKLVKDDGTINILNETTLTKKETIEILNNRLNDVFDDLLIKWLDKNIPNYLEKYFKKKDI